MIEDENEDIIEYKEKDIVWAKVKGNLWWPSIISNISFHNIQSNGENIKEKLYSIELIGENNNAKVSKEKIEPFIKNYDKHINTKNHALLKSIELAKKFSEKKLNQKILFLKDNSQDIINKKDKDMNSPNSQNMPTKKRQESSDEKSEEKENDKNIKFLQKKRLNERVILDDNDEENNIINNLDNINKEDKKVISSPKNNIKINININLTTNNQNMVNINSFHPSDVLTHKNPNNNNIISNINYSNLLTNEQNTNINNNQNNDLNRLINIDEESIVSSIEKEKNKEENKDNLKNQEKNEKNKQSIESLDEENESEEDAENDEAIITKDEIKEIIKTLLNNQIQLSNISSQKTIIAELIKFSEKLNELFLKNPDLEIYNLTKDLIPILITFTYNKNNDILIKSSEILSFLNEKIIKEIFIFSQKEKNNLIDSLIDEKNEDNDKDDDKENEKYINNNQEIKENENEDKDFKEGLKIIDVINQININKNNISDHQHIFSSKRGRPKKNSMNSETDYFGCKLGEGFNNKDNFNLSEKNVYDEFMNIISCKDKIKMENDFKELSSYFFNNIYDKNNNDLDLEIAKIRKQLCLKIFKIVHKSFPEINSNFLKKVIVYFEYKIRTDNSNMNRIYSNKINSLFEIIKERLEDKTK